MSSTIKTKDRTWVKKVNNDGWTVCESNGKFVVFKEGEEPGTWEIQDENVDRETLKEVVNACTVTPVEFFVYKLDGQWDKRYDKKS